MRIKSVSLNRTNNFLLCLLVLLAIYSVGATVSTQTDIRYERLSDGVEHWYRIKPAEEKPWFFQQLENIFDVVLSQRDKLPFGKSVAFLVGVSDYKYLSPDLPFVKNDLQDMRQFLVSKGGFDEVYVASETIVNRDLIEDYIRNKFPRWLKREDRLLFYYSGHGDDAGGRTGYMQFSNARKNNFAGAQILPIKDITYWCDEIDINHLLFILDCCASGLAFSPKGTADEIQQMIATLSRNGSRTIITAGTAEEQTFEVSRIGGKGNGVFTRALLNALEIGMTDKGKDGFLTVEEIFARTKDEVAAFASRYKKNLTPRWWQYDEGNYRGIFIFINPEAKTQRIVLADNYSEAMAATPKGQKMAEFGTIQLRARVSGNVYIDGSYIGNIESGDVINYDQPVGRHNVELITASKTFAKNVDVIKGKIQSLAMGTITVTPIRQPEKPTRLTRVFRENPKKLSEADVKDVLKKYDFYCREYSWSENYSNPDGQGFSNQFELKTIQGDAVVIDHASGLMWQQSGSSEYMNYEEAKKWIEDLNNKGFAGFRDWRLPTLEEAMSLMEPEQSSGYLYIDPKFTHIPRWIWTSDFYSSAGAWVVVFSGGICYHYSFYDTNAVRVVR